MSKRLLAKPLLLGAAALLLVPLVCGEFHVNLASQVLIAALFATSLNLLIGHAGLASLGHSAFLGTSAYVTAWLYLKLGVGHLPSAAIALLATTAMGAIFGMVALRASGIGFLMITLALSQVLWGLSYRWVTVTNGDNGLAGLTRPTPLGIDLDNFTCFYYFVASIFIAGCCVMFAFAASPMGAVLRGTRDQPRRMAALGHNVWLTRYLTFIFSAAWAGVAGLLYAYYHKFVHPQSLSILSSAEAILMVISGGAGTLLGPVVGAALVVLTKNYLSSFIEHWTMVLGGLFLAIVLYMPDGIAPGIRRLALRLMRVAASNGRKVP